MSTRNSKAARAARATQMRQQRERTDRRRRNLITVAVVVVVMGLIVAAGITIAGANKPEAAGQITVPKVDSDATGQVEGMSTATTENGYLYDQRAATGSEPKNKPVPVVLYEDFQCPACGVFEQQSGRYLQHAVALGQISVEYRMVDFIDDIVKNGDYSNRAAQAAACAFTQGGAKSFVQLHTALYAQQPEEGSGGLDNAQLSTLAADAGAKDIGSCLSDRTYSGFVDQTTKKWSANYNSTPTVVVAGKQVSRADGGAPSMGQIKAAVTAAHK